MSRCDPGKNPDMRDLPAKGFRTQAVYFTACHTLVYGIRNTDLSGNSKSSLLIVSCDHSHLDSCSFQDLDRGGGFLSGGIDHSCHSRKDQPSHKTGLCLFLYPFPVSQSQDPQTFLCHLFHGQADLHLSGLGHKLLPVADLDITAFFQKIVAGPFYIDCFMAAVSMYTDHIFLF